MTSRAAAAADERRSGARGRPLAQLFILLRLILASSLLASPTLAGEGPSPPSAPTPDEALSGAPVPGQAQGAPDGAGAGEAKPDPSQPASADASARDKADAIRKEQQNGSYRMKEGGMYQPPSSRPAPLWNEGYGRT